MTLSTRQHDIIELVRQSGFLSVDALAEQFSVTPQTIRRDINSLCDANLLRRRHGGAEYVAARSLNQPYGDRRINHLAAKQAIGAYVARLVPNRASISFGIGTTPEFAARAMIDHEDLTVVTNNLNVAMTLGTNPSNRIILPGGSLRLPDFDLLGPHVEEMYRNYRVDFGVFGVGGIEPDGTLVDFDRAEVLVRAAMQESCRSSILVADSSKFGRQAPASGGTLDQPDLIVLDVLPPPDFSDLIGDNRIGGKLRLASEAPA